MFQHLEDLKLLYDSAVLQGEPADEPANDLTLAPPSVPPLQGRLTMTCFTRVGILEDMIELFGGIRFRDMDLFYVRGMRLLLDASASTLETLRLYPNDPLGEEVSLKVIIFQLTVLQSNPSLRTLIYRGTNHFARLKLRHGASI
jgi:hypothetical protein